MFLQSKNKPFTYSVYYQDACKCLSNTTVVHNVMVWISFINLHPFGEVEYIYIVLNNFRKNCTLFFILICSLIRMLQSVVEMDKNKYYVIHQEQFHTGQCLRRIAGGNVGLPLDTM